jgi:tetratricopeptide (TPR) repeat protein
LSLQSQSRSRLHDPGAEFLDRVTGLWSSYGQTLLIALGVIVAVGAGAFFYLQNRNRAEEQAAGQLAEANLLFWQQEYARSQEAAKKVSETFPNTPSGIDALRIAGDDAFWLGDFKGAAESYKKYLDKKGSGTIADAVRRSYAYALESSGQPAAAATEYEALVGRFDRESSAEFLSASARCFQTLGQPAEATKRLQRVIDEFGETSYAQMARIRMGELGAAR